VIDQWQRDLLVEQQEVAAIREAKLRVDTDR